MDHITPRNLRRLLIGTLWCGLACAGNLSLPVFFVPNQGLTDVRYRYVARARGLTAGFAKDSVMFRLAASQIQLRFRGANRDVDVTAIRPLSGRANFFRGTISGQEGVGLPTFAELEYRNLYPGIDLVYTGTDDGAGAGHSPAAGLSELKSEFHVAAGADPARIIMTYSQPLALADDGDLLMGDSGRELREKAPDVYQYVYQDVYQGTGFSGETGRRRVRARYRLLDSHTVAFELGSYDRAKPLVIDPVISYATYLGGSNTGAVTGTAVDSNGNLYLAGWTAALDFPTFSPVQSANGGDVDAFVVKLNSTGTALIYATYIGGNGDDQAAGIAVDSAGEAYVTGSTNSYNFPLIAPIRTTLGGSKTAFVLKINNAGNKLLFSTYLGGTAYDMGTAIALDSSGNAWVAGDTQSANFPLHLPLQAALAGQTDIFLTKLTSAGALGFSTFWGGSGAEHAGGVALDPAGNIYVAGGTYSTNLPVVAALQPANAGNQDAFVLKINSAATAVIYATYLGGSGIVTGEQANGIAADPSGNAYVTGVTNSSNFPVKAGTVQQIFGGVQDAFITKVNPSGSALVYSTYLGGSDFDWANGIGLDTAGNVYVAGYTSSFDFPTTGGVQAGFDGLYDAFVSMINTTGGVLVFSTYYGGSGSDVANAITVDGSGNMYVGGQTNSVDLPLQTPLQPANTGGATGWVARLGVTAPPPQTPAAVSVTPVSGSGGTAIFTAKYSDTGGGSALTAAGILVNASAGTSFACWITYVPSSNSFALADDTPSAGSVTTPPGGTSVQNDQCTLNAGLSSAAISGNTLTLTVSLTFQSGFAGAKSVYLSAADATSATGFVTLGSWTVAVTGPAPSVVSVSPNGSAGAAQTFVFTFADAASAANLTAVAMLFSTSTADTNACLIVVDRNAGTIALLWDSGLGSNSKAIGSATTLQNDQCGVGANSAVPAGQDLTVTVAVFFTGSFNGPKNIYLEAAEGSVNTGLIEEGTFTVIAAGVPTATSVVPNSGSGTGERFSFTITDPGGSGYLTDAAMLFGTSSANLNNTCLLEWNASEGTIRLSYDIQANGSTPIVPGTNTTASNSQCAVNAANTTVLIGNTTVVVTVDLTFAAGWAGSKNIFLYAAETGSNSGWITVGTWTVTSGIPTAASVAPSSGAGHFPQFVFTTADSSAASNILTASMLFTVGSPANIANACSIVVNRSTNQIGLYDNTGTILSTKTIGSAANLGNSQCGIGYAAVNTSGTSVSFTVQVQFSTSGFAGPKSVYLQANEFSSSSGWVSVGTWTAQ